MLRKPLAICRALLMALTTVVFLSPLLLIVAVSGPKPQLGLRVRQAWAHVVCWIAGIRYRRTGQPLGEACFYVSNHRSYFDPIITLMHARALPVAKADIRRWPLIGFAAAATGIHFVERASKSSRSETVRKMAATVKAGSSILIYPEGTTTGAPRTGDFKAGAFFVAAQQAIPVVPVAVDYGAPEDYWVGDWGFGDHFLYAFGKWRTRVTIDYGPALRSDDARTLLDQTKNWIDARLAIHQTFTLPESSPTNG